MEFADSPNVLIKKIQGRMAERTNRGKWEEPDFNTTTKTKVIDNIIIRGVIMAHVIPKIEAVYLSFKFFNIRFFKISL